MSIVYLLLGSNMGNKLNYLIRAISLIERNIGDITRTSGIYETTPWGFKDDRNFFNQVISVYTTKPPRELLDIILSIETQLGRKRIMKGYQNRVIDIDILLYDNEILKCNDLEIPHPRLHLRNFALEPLCEIAPDLMHPIFKKEIKILLNECTDDGYVARILSAE